jgi:hypothetical protein
MHFDVSLMYFGVLLNHFGCVLMTSDYVLIASDDNLITVSTRQIPPILTKNRPVSAIGCDTERFIYSDFLFNY